MFKAAGQTETDPCAKAQADDARMELSGFGPDRIAARNRGPSWPVLVSLLAGTILMTLSWLPALAG